MSLQVCERCRGFVPGGSDACPHCRAAARRGRTVTAGAIALAAVLAAGVLWATWPAFGVLMR